MSDIYIAHPKTLNQHADHAAESDGLVRGSETIRRCVVAINGIKVESMYLSIYRFRRISSLSAESSARYPETASVLLSDLRQVVHSRSTSKFVQARGGVDLGGVRGILVT